MKTEDMIFRNTNLTVTALRSGLHANGVPFVSPRSGATKPWVTNDNEPRALKGRNIERLSRPFRAHVFPLESPRSRCARPWANEFGAVGAAGIAPTQSDTVSFTSPSIRRAHLGDLFIDCEIEA